MKANGEKKVDEKALLESPLVVKIQVSFSLDRKLALRESKQPLPATRELAPRNSLVLAPRLTRRLKQNNAVRRRFKTVTCTLTLI